MKNAPKKPIISPDKFNEMKSREKWESYKKTNRYFRCPKCKHESTPSTCSPIPGAYKECKCGYMLTERTGGGQNDPFRWECFKK